MAHIYQNEAGPSTNILSSYENDTKDDRAIALILSEEYANLDNAIARRLSNLSSVPVRCCFLLFWVLCELLDV